MPETLTVKEAEAIRTRLGLSVYQFSVRIGLSPTAYKKAVDRRALGRLMAHKIRTHCQPQLREVLMRRLG